MLTWPAPFVSHQPLSTDSPASETQPLQSTLVLIAALAAMGGLVHVGAAVDHFAEFPLYTAVFLLLAACQFGWAALILRGASARMLLAGCAFNMAVIGLWAVSRTVGVPIAPTAWVPESVGVADLVETASEIVVVLAAWSIAMTPRWALARFVSGRVNPLILLMLLLCSLYGVGSHAG